MVEGYLKTYINGTCYDVSIDTHTDTIDRKTMNEFV